MNKKQSALLITMSISGFFLIIGGLFLYIYTMNFMWLILVLGGLLAILYSFTKSQSPPKQKENNKTYLPSKQIEEVLIPVKLETKEIPKEVVLETLIADESTTEALKDHYTLSLKIDNTSADALVKLIDKMESNSLISFNEAFNEDNLTSQTVFRDDFKPIPIIGLVKNRENSFNVLAGLTHSDVESIGTISEDDLDYVNEIYPRTQNIRALISGGKYRSPENTIHDQAYRVSVTFFA